MINLPEHLDLDNPEFVKAYEILQHTDANVFLTGKAGTGKSTFLRYICKNLNKKFVVLAPTGVAAVNVGGVTIHSFFQMPLRPVPPDDKDYSYAALKKSGKLSRKKRSLISELELIVIDEVSMVRPDMIDFIDRTLRAVRDKRRVPFGGVQLLLVGDIFQLEPVVTPDTKNILAKYYFNFFFFNARAFHSANLVAIELKKIYRQTDCNFIRLLDRIRINEVTTEDLINLNKKVGVEPHGEAQDGDKSIGITLTSRRDVAAMINKEKLDQLPSQEIVFEGEIKDDFPDNILPTDLSLVLKKDAQVMLIRNDKDHRWVNGTLARIVEISPDEIKVRLDDGRCEKVEKEVWSNISYEYNEEEKQVKENTLGTFTQYPLKTAWALTIHKSQGLTFNNVIIDMGNGAFTAGQTYVALSRCRSLEGLSFINPLRKYDVIVSQGAVLFSKKFNDSMMFEKVLTDSKVKNLSRSALYAFRNGDYGKAIEDVWTIHAESGALGETKIRRFIGRLFGEFKKLKKTLEEKDNKLRQLSKEFLETGKNYLEYSEDIESALKYFERAYDLNMLNDEAAYLIAQCYAEKGKINKSKKLLDVLIANNSPMSYKALMLKGTINSKQNNLSGSVLNFLAAARLRPNEKEPLCKVIEVYENFGMDNLAEEYRHYLLDL